MDMKDQINLNRKDMMHILDLLICMETKDVTFLMVEMKYGILENI